MPATVNKSGQESEVRQVVGPRDECTTTVLLSRNTIKSTFKDFIIPIGNCISPCSLSLFFPLMEIKPEIQNFSKRRQ